MVGAVMVDGVAPQIAQSIHIPSGVIRVGIQAVPDVAAGDFLIPHAPPIPQAQVAYNQNGLGKLHIEVHALIVQIMSIDFIHQRDTFILGQLRVFCFQIATPVLIIQIVIAPDNVFVLTHRASPRSLCFGRMGWPCSS